MNVYFIHFFFLTRSNLYVVHKLSYIGGVIIYELNMMLYFLEFQITVFKMPFKSKKQEKIFNNVNQFKKPQTKMETDQPSYDEADYNPFDGVDSINDVLDSSLINDEFLVEMIDIILTDCSLRNISVYTYSLLKKIGISYLEIRKCFLNIGLQKEQTCRQNIMKFHKHGFDLNSGGLFYLIKIV